MEVNRDDFQATANDAMPRPLGHGRGEPVLSLNLHRRQLTPSQLSMVAGRARAIYDQQAKERQKRKPDSVQANLPEQKEQSRDAAGRAVGVSGKSVDYASIVLSENRPPTIAQDERGGIGAAVITSRNARAETLTSNSTAVAQVHRVDRPTSQSWFAVHGDRDTAQAILPLW